MYVLFIYVSIYYPKQGSNNAKSSKVSPTLLLSDGTPKPLPVISLDDETTTIKTPAPPQLARIPSTTSIKPEISPNLPPSSPPIVRSRVDLLGTCFSDLPSHFSEEHQRQELIPHIELFSECAAKCTLNLSTNTQNVELFNEPLKGMTVSLMGMLSVSDKTQVRIGDTL